MRITLSPLSDVRIENGHMVSISHSGWMAVSISTGIPLGCWIVLKYRQSLVDPVVRPLIRFSTPHGDQIIPMTAVVFGQAEWLGRVPDDCTAIAVSPTDRPGPFRFELLEVTTVSRISLLPRALRRSPRVAFEAIGAELIQARRESHQAIRFARGGVPMAEYDGWRRRRSRPYEPDGFDAIHGGPDGLPHIRAITQELPATSDPGLEPAAASKPFPARQAGTWHRVVVGTDKISLDECCRGLDDDDLIAFLPSEALVDDAGMAALAVAARSKPGARLFYADEDQIDADGRFHSPRFKPQWSPVFHSGLDYLGSAVFFRVSALADFRELAVAALVPGLSEKLVAESREGEIEHLARCIVTLRQEKSATPPAHLTTRRLMAYGKKQTAQAATIIIPNRDHAALITCCLDGLLLKTENQNFDIIIVDNGSREAETLALYRKLEREPRVQVLAHPGPFNFSEMCNRGAATAKNPLLVFLNNDIEIIDDGWLSKLAAWAGKPDIGAVGAKLLFPDGRIQHAGVAVGMGGYADHISHKQPADDAGYLGRLQVAHELSAVTGACIAVEKWKFDAIGGFNAVNLPVELNDIDLCLRLNERGWKCLLEPNSVLVHHQSATRGFAILPFTRYGKERAYFGDRWARTIRDDPFFHPALSLYSVVPMLDG